MGKMKIYTKTGDAGTTSLVGGTRVSKGSLRLEAYGTADELNSFVGWLRAKDLPEDTDRTLQRVQNMLFNIGSCLAVEPDKEAYVADLIPCAEDIAFVEKEIDRLGENLPELKRFILPAGSERVALCHVCRTITRRLERLMVRLSDALSEEGASLPPSCLGYVNRLSDYFFVLSRNMAQIDECGVFFWKK